MADEWIPLTVLFTFILFGVIFSRLSHKRTVVFDHPKYHGYRPFTKPFTIDSVNTNANDKGICMIAISDNNLSICYNEDDDLIYARGMQFKASQIHVNFLDKPKIVHKDDTLLLVSLAIETKNNLHKLLSLDNICSSRTNKIISEMNNSQWSWFIQDAKQDVQAFRIGIVQYVYGKASSSNINDDIIVEQLKYLHSSRDGTIRLLDDSLTIEEFEKLGNFKPLINFDMLFAQIEDNSHDDINININIEQKENDKDEDTDKLNNQTEDDHESKSNTTDSDINVRCSHAFVPVRSESNVSYPFANISKKSKTQSDDADHNKDYRQIFYQRQLKRTEDIRSDREMTCSMCDSKHEIREYEILDKNGEIDCYVGCKCIKCNNDYCHYCLLTEFCPGLHGQLQVMLEMEIDRNNNGIDTGISTGHGIKDHNYVFCRFCKRLLNEKNNVMYGCDKCQFYICYQCKIGEAMQTAIQHYFRYKYKMFELENADPDDYYANKTKGRRRKTQDIDIEFEKIIINNYFSSEYKILEKTGNDAGMYFYLFMRVPEDDTNNHRYYYPLPCLCIINRSTCLQQMCFSMFCARFGKVIALLMACSPIIDLITDIWATFLYFQDGNFVSYGWTCIIILFFSNRLYFYCWFTVDIVGVKLNLDDKITFFHIIAAALTPIYGTLVWFKLFSQFKFIQMFPKLHKQHLKYKKKMISKWNDYIEFLLEILYKIDHGTYHPQAKYFKPDVQIDQAYISQIKPRPQEANGVPDKACISICGEDGIDKEQVAKFQTAVDKIRHSDSGDADDNNKQLQDTDKMTQTDLFVAVTNELTNAKLNVRRYKKKTHLLSQIPCKVLWLLFILYFACCAGGFYFMYQDLSSVAVSLGVFLAIASACGCCISSFMIFCTCWCCNKRLKGKIYSITIDLIFAPLYSVFLIFKHSIENTVLRFKELKQHVKYALKKNDNSGNYGHGNNDIGFGINMASVSADEDHGNHNKVVANSMHIPISSQHLTEQQQQRQMELINTLRNIQHTAWNREESRKMVVFKLLKSFAAIFESFPQLLLQCYVFFIVRAEYTDSNNDDTSFLIVVQFYLSIIFSLISVVKGVYRLLTNNLFKRGMKKAFDFAATGVGVAGISAALVGSFWRQGTSTSDGIVSEEQVRLLEMLGDFVDAGGEGGSHTVQNALARSVDFDHENCGCDDVGDCCDECAECGF